MTPAKSDKLAEAVRRIAEIDATEPEKIRLAKLKRKRQAAQAAKGMKP